MRLRISRIYAASKSRVCGAQELLIQEYRLSACCISLFKFILILRLEHNYNISPFPSSLQKPSISCFLFSIMAFVSLLLHVHVYMYIYIYMLLNILIYFLFMCMYMCLHGFICTMFVQNMELHVVVCCLMWAWSVELRSSGRAINALNCWTISPALLCLFLQEVFKSLWQLSQIIDFLQSRISYQGGGGARL